MAEARTVFRIANATAIPDGWFRGGILVTETGIRRFILDHIGDTIILIKPIPGFAELSEEVPQNVILYPGCDRTTKMCREKFDNLPNHGGFPFMPSRNPFNGSSIV